MTMDPELFNLTWDAFQQSAKDTFRSLINEEDFMDVTLACDDDKQIKAHKVILSSCSPFFKRILTRNPHPNPILFISGVDYRDLKAILNFMYLGETNVEQAHLDTFMAACKIIKVRGLTEPENIDHQETPHPLPTAKPRVNLPGKNGDAAMNIPHTSEKRYQDQHLVKDEPETISESNFAIAKYEAAEDFTSPFENSSKWSDGRFWCSKCDFQTGSKSNLRRHDEMKHQGIKYACDGCDYKASSKDNLKRHSMSKHEGIQFDCDQCEFKTSIKGSLKRHKFAMHRS